MHYRSPAVPPSFTAQFRRYRYWFISVVTAIALLLPTLASGVLAQDAYPVFQNPYVNDYGEILAPEDEVNVRSRLAQFQTQTGKQAVLLTINSIQDYPTGDASIESFATNLFNTWGIGDAARNDGILIVVAPGDRKVRIELGSSYPASADRVAQTIIDEYMLPQFRDGKISPGTIAGVSAVVDRFGGSTPHSSALSGTRSPEPLNPWDSLIDMVTAVLVTVSSVGIFGVVIASVPAFLILRRWQRFRKRQCPQCQTEMSRLDEVADDQYLEAGQCREESLESVDYDVWLCPGCGYHTVKSFTNYFSRYQSCAQCRHKTLSVRTETIVQPTYSSTGQARVSEDCRHCSHHRTFTKTLPKLVKSSSSSSSGSHSSSSGSHGGGGRSSGGGASGSW